MRALIFLSLTFCLGGCAPAYLVSFSNGYDPATSYINSLPTIVLGPGETRRAFFPAPKPPFMPPSNTRIESEDPRTVLIWLPFDPRDVVRLQGGAPGVTVVHRGSFPFSTWNPKVNPVQRAAWRASLRRFLHPRPDDATFRAISDADLWKTVLRSRSQGALRVIVEQDRLSYQ